MGTLKQCSQSVAALRNNILNLEQKTKELAAQLPNTNTLLNQQEAKVEKF